MNYLAHFHLAHVHFTRWQPALPASARAEAEAGALVGALLGDYVKGPLQGEWPPDWERGIALHRRIDALSDVHPLRAQLAEHLPAPWRRYAGIVLDVCCDHWLSLAWSDWHAQPLPHFARQVCAVLASHEAALPAPARRFAQRLCEHDMLAAYGDWAAVPATLARIGARLRRDNPLQAPAQASAAAATLQPYFADFYGDLQRALPPGRGGVSAAQ